MKYKVQRDYQSNIGSYDKGSTVEVEDALAEHLNRDSPGLLKPVKAEKKAETKSEPKVNVGKVEEILDRVGDDADSAANVLEAEQAESKPRKSLIEALEAVIAAADQTEG